MRVRARALVDDRVVASLGARDSGRRRTARPRARRRGGASASAAATAKLTREQCVEYVRSGCKTRDRFRCVSGEGVGAGRNAGGGGASGDDRGWGAGGENLKNAKTRRRETTDRISVYGTRGREGTDE